jgi:hypothetical protein
MIALGVLIIGFSFMGTIWLSTKIADLHYKIKDTEQPLYIIYAAILVLIWVAIALQIVS